MVKKRLVLFLLVGALLAPTSVYGGVKEDKLVSGAADFSRIVSAKKYEDVLKVVSESLMTNKKVAICFDAEIFEQAINSDLAYDVFNFKDSSKYDLAEIVDCMYYDYKLLTAEDGSVKYLMTTDCISYNEGLDLDYEDYYDSIIESLELEGMSDYEKVYYLNKYVCDSYEYADDAGLVKLADGIKNRRFLCGNYAVLMKALLNRVGVECIVVQGTSEGMPHAWNLVKVDGKWYGLDTTWNDSLGMDYYLLKGKEFNEDHTASYAYRKNLGEYELAKEKCVGKLTTAKISGISISKSNKLYVDYQLNSASVCKISVDGKSVKNNSKFKCKSGSKIKIKFNDARKSVYEYRVVGSNGRFKVVRV